MGKHAWIGLDWGTSNLRAFAINSAGAVVDERFSEKGMGKLSPGQFEPVLLELVEDWLDGPGRIAIYACGMVGARQGWVEAGYRSVPCAPLGPRELTRVPTGDPRLEVYILPGLSQAEPADVMRGEETQIAGFLAMDPHYNGSVCLPGTHSKWVEILHGSVQRFTTFMTGELYAMLTQHSVLRHSVKDGGWNQTVFLEAALRAAENPGIAASGLFSIRAANLVSGEPADRAGARLSGLLIGQELGLATSYWSRKPVALIGSNETVPLYREALLALGTEIVSVDTRSATLAGLAQAACKSPRNAA